MRPGSAPVAVVAYCTALAVALTVAVTGRDASPPALTDRPPTVTIVATRAPDLGPARVSRIARALGIASQPVPEGEGDSWLAADPQRSIVLRRAPSSWFVLFTDSSVLLEPPAPETGLPAAVSAPAPGRADADAAARNVLRQAGVIPGRWASFTGAASEMPTVCRPVPTPYDCDLVRLRARHVVFVRTVRGRPTTLEWEVLVGPGGRILDAVGRIATIARSR